MTTTRALPLFLLATLAACSAATPAATTATAGMRTQRATRPQPNPILEDTGFRRAVALGTRTRTGEPGPRYWQQHAEYRLRATLDSATRRVTGEGTVRYHNRSPDALPYLVVHLRQNLFAPGAMRNELVPITGGVTLSRVAANGTVLQPVDRADRPGVQVEGTIAYLQLPQPLAPGATATLDFAWSFIVPPDGAPRGGVDGETYFVSYWYPQVAVYDDVVGWQEGQYMGRGEFYMGFADYDVELTVPAGWLVASTGTLANAADVLSPRTRARLDSARATGAVVRVVGDAERGAGRATVAPRTGRTHTWRFSAKGQRDFAFGTSPDWLWDATRAVAADSAGATGDTVTINAFYRPSRRAWAWENAAAYARHSIEFLSRYLWPYPWAQATAADGPASCTGMEYPMITCIGGERDTLRLYSVIVHELAHFWFPMQVGSDEQRHAWMDEGLTRFNQAQAMREYFRGYDLEAIAREQYLDDVGRPQKEAPLMTWSDLYPTALSYARASYPKMATNLVALRSLLGDSTFLAAYREYGRRWRGRHPTPHDFFNTFEQVSGQDLDWFWRTWWYETWTMDHAVAAVRPIADGTEIVIEDRGLAPMPVRVQVLLSDGSTRQLGVSEDAWLGGARRHTLIVRGARVVRVELDPEHRFPDIDRSNDRWEAP